MDDERFLEMLNDARDHGFNVADAIKVAQLDEKMLAIVAKHMPLDAVAEPKKGCIVFLLPLTGVMAGLIELIRHVI